MFNLHAEYKVIQKMEMVLRHWSDFFNVVHNVKSDLGRDFPSLRSAKHLSVPFLTQLKIILNMNLITSIKAPSIKLQCRITVFHFLVNTSMQSCKGKLGEYPVVSISPRQSISSSTIRYCLINFNDNRSCSMFND